MNIVDAKIQALRLFDSNIDNSISVIIKQNDYVILDMNVQDQLFEKGVERNGIDLMSEIPYSDVTIEIKQAIGHPYDRVTLRDEGDFHRSFKLSVRSNEFEIYATDIKTEKIVAKYGDSIMGLTNENFAQLMWEYIYPELKQTLIEYLAR